MSLYCGAGGLDEGFVASGFEPIWANDFDPLAVEAYNANIPGNHARAGDIAALRRSLPRADEVDVVIGGPPCQGFSVAGHMRVDDPRSQHVWTFLDVVATLKPRAFVMENVAALATTRRWQPLVRSLKARARRLGYRVEAFVLNAAHYDVPQSRRRMFLVGIVDAQPREPEASSAEQPPTVRQALEQLPAWKKPGNDALCTAVVTPAIRPVMRPSPYAGLLFNGKGRVLNLDAPALTLPASMGGNRTPIIDQQWLEGGSSWIEWYHRRLANGGKPVAKVPKRIRRLTVQEAAALQSFKPGRKFVGSQSAQFRQIGNAVPPRLAQHVAEAVKQALGNELAARQGSRQGRAQAIAA